MYGWLLKTIPLAKKLWPESKRIIETVEHMQSTGGFRGLHEHFLHPLQRLQSAMGKKHWNGERIVGLTVDVCTGMRECVCDYLSLDQHHLHCSLKLASGPIESESAQKDPSKLVTFAKSRPFDGRDDRVVNAESESTIRAALTGGSDGHVTWPRMRCFSCNDLRSNLTDFRCSRARWWDFYQSTLVFPLKFVRNPDANDFDHIGYLCFDSPQKEVFKGMPNVFQFRDHPAEYSNKVADVAIFHLGAIFADTLSTCWHGIYDPTRDMLGTGVDNEKSSQSASSTSTRIIVGEAQPPAARTGDPNNQRREHPRRLSGPGTSRSE